MCPFAPGPRASASRCVLWACSDGAATVGHAPCDHCRLWSGQSRSITRVELGAREKALCTGGGGGHTARSPWHAPETRMGRGCGAARLFCRPAPMLVGPPPSSPSPPPHRPPHHCRVCPGCRQWCSCRAPPPPRSRPPLVQPQPLWRPPTLRTTAATSTATTAAPATTVCAATSAVAAAHPVDDGRHLDRHHRRARDHRLCSHVCCSGRPSWLPRGPPRPPPPPRPGPPPVQPPPLWRPPRPLGCFAAVAARGRAQ